VPLSKRSLRTPTVAVGALGAVAPLLLTGLAVAATITSIGIATPTVG
jgi:hypothetical protein